MDARTSGTRTLTAFWRALNSTGSLSKTPGDSATMEAKVMQVCFPN